MAGRGRPIHGCTNCRRLVPFSAPEPDAAVVPHAASAYLDRHPSEAFLVVEVSASSLPQERLSTSRIYAGAGVPEYWIVRLRDDCIEVFRVPEAAQRAYGAQAIARRAERLELVALAGAMVAVTELLPSRRT